LGHGVVIFVLLDDLGIPNTLDRYPITWLDVLPHKIKPEERKNALSKKN